MNHHQVRRAQHGRLRGGVEHTPPPRLPLLLRRLDGEGVGPQATEGREKGVFEGVGSFQSVVLHFL